MLIDKRILLIAGVVFAASMYLFNTASYPIVGVDSRGDSIVCFGDSLTFGTGADKQNSYPGQLSKMLDIPVINKGVPGDTTARALERMDEVLKFNPKVVIITLGGNDLKNGVAKEQVFGNLELMIKRFQQAGAAVVLGGIDIPFWGRGFGDAYEELARSTGSILVPNVYEGILGQRELMSDPIHPNGAGYTVMAKRFNQVLAENGVL
jgi:lysophospholipase L1-like esterase